MHMKIPFGFGGKTDKKSIYRDFSEEEYMEEEYEETEGYLEEEYEEGYIEDSEYYEEEEYEESVEYSEDYDEESYEEEYFEEEYSEEEYSEISYEEEEAFAFAYEEDDSYEEVEDDEDEEEEEGLLPFGNFEDLADKLLMFGGAAVLLIGLIIGGIFITSRLNTEKETAFLNVGHQLEQIEVIGESGLLAVSDAQKAAMEAALIEEEEEASKEYEEQEYKTDVSVKLSIASIEKDLKIKFVNKETGKLVGNVPFNLQITDPDGKQALWSDDDMDGIIYKKNLKAGKYKISVNQLEEEKYKKYGLPSGEQKAEVKANME